MVLGEPARTIYLRAKENLVAEVPRLYPRSVRAWVEEAPNMGEAQSTIAVRQLSLLRTAMRADLGIFGDVYRGALTDLDKDFLRNSGARLWRAPWWDGNRGDWIRERRRRHVPEPLPETRRDACELTSTPDSITSLSDQSTPMYRLVSRFIVPPQHQPAFIEAVRADREGSLREEAPNTRRLDLIRDERDPNCFYLDEEYVDKNAFDAHIKGPWFRGFFEEIIGKAEEGPCGVLKGFGVD